MTPEEVLKETLKRINTHTDTYFAAIRAEGSPQQCVAMVVTTPDGRMALCRINADSNGVLNMVGALMQQMTVVDFQTMLHTLNNSPIFADKRTAFTLPEGAKPN
jgi:hypothetical protein